MTSRDFITAEATNTDRIILYREGLFWKAYERSAYALCSQVRPLKPTRKVLKALRGGDLISVGFPSASESMTLAGLETVERSENRWVVTAPQRIDETQFLSWKRSVPAKVQTIVSPAPAAVPAPDSTATVPIGSTASENASQKPTVDSDAVVSDDRAAGCDVSAPVRISWLRRVLGAFRSCNPQTECSGGFASEGDIARRIVQSIKEFDLADKTPMDCMRFIAEWKKRLTNF